MLPWPETPPGPLRVPERTPRWPFSLVGGCTSSSVEMDLHETLAKVCSCEKPASTERLDETQNLLFPLVGQEEVNLFEFM